MFTVGQKVRLVHPESEAERTAQYVVIEWNDDGGGDYSRGMIRLICDLRIPPVELVRGEDIQVLPDYLC